MTPQERTQLDDNLYKLETKLDFVRRIHEMGALIVASTEAIQEFGAYAIGLELLHRAGLSLMEVIVAATSGAARAIGLEDQVGTLRPGMLADFVHVDGDPLTDVQALGRVLGVVLGGRAVVTRFNLEEGMFVLPGDSQVLAPLVG